MTNCVKVFTIRLQAGDDIKDEIETFVSKHNLKAAFIMTCVGTLKSVTLALNATPKLGPPFPAFEKVRFTHRIYVQKTCYLVNNIISNKTNFSFFKLLLSVCSRLC